MKLRTLLMLFVSLFITTALTAQEDVMVIDGGKAGGAAGLLEATINGDTTGTGERANPNRIYELMADDYYIQNGPIIVTNPDGVLTIRGQEGGVKPVIVKQQVDGVPIGNGSSVEGDLVIKNVQWHVMEDDGSVPWYHMSITGEHSALVVEDCVFENIMGIIFNMNPVETIRKIELRNNYWRDLHDFSQWWAARIVQFHHTPVDSLIMENNTVSGGGLTVLGQEGLIDYAVINHNTFINNHKYPFLNQYWREVYFTNNLFVNANMVGEDTVNVATGGQDPDALLHGITGVDTIELSIALQGKYMNADSTELTAEVDGLDDIIYYCADNVIVSSATLDNYYAGGLNDNADFDAPESYLEWSGVNEAPYAVLNVPGIWSNERTEALIADWDNIKAENNDVYTMRAADLGLGTDPLPQDAADVFAQWNRNQWGVPGAELPTDYSPYRFGDYDPATIPGVETEDGSGVTKISDFVEDFSYSTVLTSQSDGLRIGALHWNDEAFDAAASLAAVKSAYDATSGLEEQAFDSEVKLINYPNPFSSTTTIRFDLPYDSHVNLSVYDVSGRLVKTLLNENRPTGTYSVEFTPEQTFNGAYFYRLTTDKHTATRKMMLLK
ncbi:MAG: T9SS type A sorting domain-containing protein [Bacteroidota bacterium]